MALLGSNPHPKDLDMHAGMTSARRILAALMGAALAVNAATSSAADGAFYGLLRSRDLTPFGFLRLDMRPAHAVAIEPGSWALETELGYQNTWASEPGGRELPGRSRAAGPARPWPRRVAAIRGSARRELPVDVEPAALDVTLHYKFSTNWTGYLIASAVSYQGGFLDGTIESFTTRSASAPSAGPAASATTVNLIFDLKIDADRAFDSPDGWRLDRPDDRLALRRHFVARPWKLCVRGRGEDSGGRASDSAFDGRAPTTACRRPCSASATITPCISMPPRSISPAQRAGAAGIAGRPDGSSATSSSSPRTPT